MVACSNKVVLFGVKQNSCQFVLLIIVNALVGALLGLERTHIPAWADWHFGINQHTYILSFIAVFGFFKAITNLTTGFLMTRYSRKTILVAGWLVAFPIPFLLSFQSGWGIMLVANALLGIQQGLTWSTTVVMKMDIVNNKQRGLAMGLNEFAGYFALAISAWLIGQQSVFDYETLFPILPAFIIIITGLLMSVIFINDTQPHVDLSIQQASPLTHITNPFKQTTFNNPTLRTFTQVGFVNNLNDGLMWGLLPALCWSYQFGQSKLALLAGLYPAVWAIGQLITGPWSDKFDKGLLLFVGMLMQAFAIAGLASFNSYPLAISFVVILGFGTALVYPTCLTGIAAHSHPSNRAQSLGVYRFWRDFGYVVGALLTGLIADAYNISTALLVVAFITLSSGIYAVYTQKKFKLKL
jgi:MFS family permease